MSIVIICNEGHIMRQKGLCPTCSTQAKYDRRKWHKPPRKKWLVGGYHAYYEMVRHDMTLSPRRLKQRVSKGDAIRAWRSWAGCSEDQAEHAARRLWTRPRISIDEADEWCLALGSHLAVVYPEVYYVPVGRGNKPKKQGVA